MKLAIKLSLAAVLLGSMLGVAQALIPIPTPAQLTLCKLKTQGSALTIVSKHIVPGPGDFSASLSVFGEFGPIAFNSGMISPGTPKIVQSGEGTFVFKQRPHPAGTEIVVKYTHPTAGTEPILQAMIELDDPAFAVGDCSVGSGAAPSP